MPRDAVRLAPAVLALGIAVSLSSGCLRWTPGYHTAAVPAATTGDDAAALLAQAAELVRTAESRDDALALVALTERAVAAAPGEYAALLAHGEYCLLMGAAHSATRGEKKGWYVRGIQSLERAMYTDEGFRAALDAGEPFEVAVTRLGPDRVDALFVWTQGVNYMFKECLLPPQIPFHVQWIVQTRHNLEQLTDLDPDFRGGAARFAWAIYYLGLPERHGGDMQRSAELFEEAIAVTPESLVFRWGRAKYWRVKAGDRDGFVEDLEWVVAQDPDVCPDPSHPWAVYMQHDARRMLAEVDRYF